MNWKTDYRSFYYEGAEAPEDFDLVMSETVLLCIDVQNTYMAIPDNAAERTRWAPFHRRMTKSVIPRTAALQSRFRAQGLDVLHARIACLLDSGKDRSLSQKKPGWNYLLLPKDREDAQIVDALAPKKDEIVVTKTTDSALTGTNLRLILSNMGIKNVVLTGIFTDQCISSTVRSLADESFNVILIEDCCAAGTDELHNRELEILNMIYCQVMTCDEVLKIMGLPLLNEVS
ncbi:MAG: cysteine hydrolase [Methylococcales bacterium]|jgi:biuret amidohydrolase|nr:cysteine hydrolase [Methylococcales bacterium]MBT7442371.1 cysteine hydrolase [Methylococcales bacterium]